MFPIAKLVFGPRSAAMEVSWSFSRRKFFLGSVLNLFSASEIQFLRIQSKFLGFAAERFSLPALSQLASPLPDAIRKRLKRKFLGIAAERFPFRPFSNLLFKVRGQLTNGCKVTFRRMQPTILQFKPQITSPTRFQCSRKRLQSKFPAVSAG